MRLELQALDQGREWTRQRLERLAQDELNGWAMKCPQSGQLLLYRKSQRLKLTTTAGVIILKTTRGYSKAQGRWINPTRQRWGLKPRQRVSPELQSKLAYTATVTGSYEKAAATATRWGTQVSDDSVHAVVQQLGAAAQGLILPAIPPPKPEPEFSMVIMMDGWMVRRRGPHWGAGRRKKNAQRVEWKEVKSAVIYRLEQSVKKASGRGLLLQKYIVACPPETSPVDFGAAVQTEARRRGLGRAKKVYVVIDGAVWLWHVAQDRFSSAIHVLDFHHASEHLWAVAHTLHGQESPEARTWVEPLLHKLRHGQEEQVVHTLAALLEKNSGLKRNTQAAVRTEVEYFQTHRDHLSYGKLARQGAPIGSGPAESLCSQLQDRFKRTGQFWKASGLRHLLTVNSLLRNEDLDVLWN
ncbi:MAG: ISKra4 family transposase [Burkholderiales bacterium]